MKQPANKSFAVLVLLIGLCPLAWAQTYPTKPIRVIVPFPAGESIDATARLIAQQWQTALGQQMVIDNRGERAARSAPK